MEVLSATLADLSSTLEELLATLTQHNGVLLTDLSVDVLSLILYRLPLAHDIARTRKTCRTLKHAADLAFALRPFTGKVHTLSDAHCLKGSSHMHIVESVAATGDGHIITSSHDRTVKVWFGDEVVTTISPNTVSVGVAALPDGERFISVSRDDTASPDGKRFVNLYTLDGARERSVEVGDVICVAALPDGAHFVVGLFNGEVRLYRVDGTLVHNFKWPHTGAVIALTVTHDGQHIISGGYDSTVKVWSVASKSLVRAVRHNECVWAVAVMPDGQRILSAGGNDTSEGYDDDVDVDLRYGAVHVWLRDGHMRKTFEVHVDLASDQFAAFVNALVALPDNQHALSGATDHTVKLFNVNDGTVMRTFTHHRNCVKSLALLPDGLRFVSGSDDSTACIVEHGLAPQ
jgi:WD40 repeat protein